ncbi:MAG: Gfo/Idh/MocA family oxidoreductase [Verrucomicrobiota bacterium]
MKINKAYSEKKASVLPPHSRREFLRAGALTVAAASFASYVGKAQDGPAAAPYVGNVKGANDAINVACIGVGGQGEGDTGDIIEMKNRNVRLVAMCDVDKEPLDKMAARAPEAKLYSDFRTMLTEMDKSIDAVTVTIPDHNHAMATMFALNMGKHVFCQKPLTQTVWEARQVRDLAKAKKLATQMGNQGSDSTGLRRAV